MCSSDLMILATIHAERKIARQSEIEAVTASIDASPDVEDLFAIAELQGSEDYEPSTLVPLYYVACEYMSLEARDFFVPPQPGMLAWAQHRHALDFDQCLYVVASDQSRSAALDWCGMRVILGSQLFDDSGWDLLSKMYVALVRLSCTIA